ncbi:hypothetical protein J1614_004981 [Plenodomus biglobosus]|nr:hypothetical protein J1614_004981 [Plenodomus biglobosus]
MASSLTYAPVDFATYCRAAWAHLNISTDMPSEDDQSDFERLVQGLSLDILFKVAFVARNGS